MTNTTAPRTAIEALGTKHPQHVERIVRHNDVINAGAIVVINGKGDTGSFFTGIRNGDTVVVRETHSSGRSVTHLDGDSASLSVHNASNTTLTPVHPEDWTLDMAKSAQNAATKAAHEKLERAYTSANRLLGAPGSDEAALDALREAKELRDYAFAVGVLITRLTPGNLDYWRAEQDRADFIAERLAARG